MTTGRAGFLLVRMPTSSVVRRLSSVAVSKRSGMAIPFPLAIKPRHGQENPDVGVWETPD
jgi:hypothetical protein